MGIVILTKEQYNDMVMRIEEIKTLIIQNSKENKDCFIHKEELHQLLNIGKRKRGTWKAVNIFILIFKIIIDLWFKK